MVRPPRAGANLLVSRVSGSFTNAVNTGQFKICKASHEPTLQGVSFDFEFHYLVNGTQVDGTASLTPGTCSSLSAPIPVVDANGDANLILVFEAITPGVAVSNIAVQNGTLTASDPDHGGASFSTNQGFSTITFTNVRTPILPE